MLSLDVTYTSNVVRVTFFGGGTISPDPDEIRAIPFPPASECLRGLVISGDLPAWFVAILVDLVHRARTRYIDFAWVAVDTPHGAIVVQTDDPGVVLGSVVPY